MFSISQLLKIHWNLIKRPTVLHQFDTQTALSQEQALSLADVDNTADLADIACKMRDYSHRNIITFFPFMKSGFIKGSPVFAPPF